MTAKINSLDKLLPEMEVDFRKRFPLKNPWGTISYRNINNNTKSRCHMVIGLGIIQHTVA